MHVPYVINDPVVGYLNDIWCWSEVTMQWTWVAGSNTNDLTTFGAQWVESATSIPGGRSEMGSTYNVTTRMMYVFGGFGYTDTSTADWRLGDVWRFNMITKRWMFVGGNPATYARATLGALGIESSANKLGDYRGQSAVLDNDRLYVFGGDGWGSATQTSM